MWYNFLLISCIIYSGDLVLSWLAALVAGCGVYLYPLVLMILLNAALAYKLNRLSYQRRSLHLSTGSGTSNTGTASKSHGNVSSKERNAAVVLLTLVMVHLTVYLPTCVLWVMWDLGTVLGGFSLYVGYFIMSTGYVFLLLTITVKIWNFYIYLARVPFFAKTLFTCFGYYTCDSFWSVKSTTNNSHTE